MSQASASSDKLFQKIKRFGVNFSLPSLFVHVICMFAGLKQRKLMTEQRERKQEAKAREATSRSVAKAKNHLVAKAKNRLVAKARKAEEEKGAKKEDK